MGLCHTFCLWFWSSVVGILGNIVDSLPAQYSVVLRDEELRSENRYPTCIVGIYNGLCYRARFVEGCVEGLGGVDLVAPICIEEPVADKRLRLANILWVVDADPDEPFADSSGPFLMLDFSLAPGSDFLEVLLSDFYRIDKERFSDVACRGDTHKDRECLSSGWGLFFRTGGSSQTETDKDSDEHDGSSDNYCDRFTTSPFS